MKKFQIICPHHGVPVYIISTIAENGADHEFFSGHKNALETLKEYEPDVVIFMGLFNIQEELSLEEEIALFNKIRSTILPTQKLVFVGYEYQKATFAYSENFWIIPHDNERKQRIVQEEILKLLKE